MVTNEDEDVIFFSGEFDENGQIINEALPYEPHHDVINSEQQTQIYQMVMANVEGEVTTTLLHADHHLKDNRLVPMGFSYSHPSYDTIAVVGAANSDENYNENQSGTDAIFYHIPIQNDAGDLHITAKVYYQTVNSRWLVDLFNEESDEINAFENMYNQADLNPILMKAAETISQSVGNSNPLEQQSIQVFPNPFIDHINISNAALLRKMNIYNAEGKLIKSMGKSELSNSISLETGTGIYYFELIDETENRVIKKMVKY
jgi:hypothetical protein